MDIHELKQRLQQHFSDGLVTIVGSGLSCAEGMPGMATLSDHLLDTIGPGLSDPSKELWHKIEPAMRASGLEAALLKIPPNAELESAISSAIVTLIGSHERSIIAQVFLGKRVLPLTRLIAHMLKPASGVPFVTTNYDRLVEVAAEEAGLGVDTMFVGRFAARLDERESRLSFCRNVLLKKNRAVYKFQSRAAVFKPHGSLDWYFRADRPIQYEGELDGVPRLVITPGNNKFRNGYESPFDHHRAKANEAIDRASRFLILGYGFNDDHLETHLTPAIRGGKPTLIMTLNLSPAAERLAATSRGVIALDQQFRGGISGTRAIVEGSELWFEQLSLWDVGFFVTEVLES